ncbi:hypothetical protein QYE76_012175 [Lolium multiflorum]|uniref:Peptidase C1A papain C-terminal domain-containing protein n=1 Tax=Lolium multiflorum TaxID=4521 RepID=A0AAD8X3F5_LOLMU|nr:hypothetical protein QYE76_012175 [Lolium multiflorum]
MATFPVNPLAFLPDGMSVDQGPPDRKGGAREPTEGGVREPAGGTTGERAGRRTNGGDYVFRFYDSGVMDGSECGTELNHAVTAVGYGTASDGSKYWLMKNSRGASWGEGGYVRIRRGPAPRFGPHGRPSSSRQRSAAQSSRRGAEG